MTRCLDIHTHHPAPQPMGVVSADFSAFEPLEGQWYSIGIHPWTTDKSVWEADWTEFERLAALPCVVAIGECGIDKLRGGAMFKQLLVFKRQIEISEKLEKPLIIHDVKAHDIIVGLKKDINPTQKWLVHGLRAKPTVAKMLTDAGIYVSFGEKFNPGSAAIVPEGMMLAETDESPLQIEEIIAEISSALGKDVTSIISQNTSRFLNVKNNETFI